MQEGSKEQIKRQALALGFETCGIARAGPLDKLEQPFNQWLENGWHADMAYMARNRDKRLDPRLLFPGAKSVIVVAQNYYPQAFEQEHPVEFKLSKYAYGLDYHLVIKKKLLQLSKHIETIAPGTQNRVFTDSAPVMERAWAVAAGLGWIGKNASLIIPRKGSFFFLAEIITTMDIEADMPFTKKYCGSCTLCMDACPTAAIKAPGQIDARRCISYQTIENKGPIPQEIREKKGQWIFGCDTCQDVCPHNRFASPHQEPAFEPVHGISHWPAERWKTLTRATFKNLFVKGGSPIARVKYKKLMENIKT